MLLTVLIALKTKIMEFIMEIKELQAKVHESAVANGWWTDFKHHPDTLARVIALTHSELSESLEEVREGRYYTYYSKTDLGDKPEGMFTELADAVIRIMDLFGHYHISLEDTIIEKLAYNDLRGFKHGGKII